MIELVRSDFNSIGQIATHCNLPKLQIAIQEAILFDLKPLLCDLFFDVEANWRSENEPWKDIMFPHIYEGCNNCKQSHQGLVQVLTRYAYARYVIINYIDDTPNGGVTKTNNWSIPKPYQDLKQISNKYRDMGKYLFEEVEAFICLNKDLYPGCSNNCKSCGCNGKCGTTTKIKGFGLRGFNVNNLHKSKHYGL